VPFAAGGETEQTLRAERLELMGLARMIAEERLTPQRLAAAIDMQLARPKPEAHTLDVDGARKSAEALRDLHERRAATPTRSA
jgi:predicted glycosyltransferase